MKKGILTILFMVALTVIFIASLAWVNESSKARIAQNLEVQRVQSILYACNILPEGVDEKALPGDMTTDELPWSPHLLNRAEDRIMDVAVSVTPEQKRLLADSFLTIDDSVHLFLVLNDSGQIDGYGFPLKGKGLWGSIAAVGVISADLKRMVGIDFTEQVETPGLGARITETAFKYHFRGLDLSAFAHTPQDEPAVIMVANKDVYNSEESTNAVESITGATQTCNGVLDMLNTDLRFYLDVIRENRDYLQSLI